MPLAMIPVGDDIDCIGKGRRRAGIALALSAALVAACGSPSTVYVGGAMLASAQVPAQGAVSSAQLTPVAAQAKGTTAGKSVYGEDAAWKPARTSQPVTAGYEPQASAQPVHMSGSREGVWR